MTAGHLAMERYKIRRPHALMSFTQMARLLDIAYELRKFACGIETVNPPPDFSIGTDYKADIRRSYGHLFPNGDGERADSFQSVVSVPGGSTPASSPDPKPPASKWQHPLATPYPPEGPSPEERRQHDVWSVPLKRTGEGLWMCDWSRARSA